MSPQEFNNIYPHLFKWIQQSLTVHASQAQIVSSVEFTRLPAYYSSELLETAKFVIVNKIPMPPLSAMGLTQFAEFEKGNFRGMTYLDTFFVKSEWAQSESLFFHELVHILQWRILGPEIFLRLYAQGLESLGYRNSPLEVMAYNAEARFNEKTEPFDAEKLVSEELQKFMKF
jgi:hypothetical protein